MREVAKSQGKNQTHDSTLVKFELGRCLLLAILGRVWITIAAYLKSHVTPMKMNWCYSSKTSYHSAWWGLSICALEDEHRKLDLQEKSGRFPRFVSYILAWARWILYDNTFGSLCYPMPAIMQCMQVWDFNTDLWRVVVCDWIHCHFLWQLHMLLWIWPTPPCSDKFHRVWQISHDWGPWLSWVQAGFVTSYHRPHRWATWRPSAWIEMSIPNKLCPLYYQASLTQLEISVLVYLYKFKVSGYEYLACVKICSYSLG